MASKLTQDEVQEHLDELENYEEDFDAKERSFFENMIEQVGKDEKKFFISEGQSEWLRKMKTKYVK